MKSDTETHCHCSAAYNGSDHCPECGCEQYETYGCDDAPDIGVLARVLSCPFGQDGERVCCGQPGACMGPMSGRVSLREELLSV